MRNLRNNTRVCALIIYFVSVSAISAAAGQNSISGSEFCAEREVLLMVLLEAQASPNGAFDKMSAEDMMLMKARAACDSGQVGDATMLYDQLITKLEMSLAQNSQ